MAQFSVDARTPLGPCLGLNAPTDNHNMPLQTAWDRKQALEAQARYQEEARIIQVLEKTCFSHKCGWRECNAVLGSWDLLKKHMEKMHCKELSSGQVSSSRPYRCYYAKCQNRIFSLPALLLEHVVSSHLEQLKLRCPFGCKQSLTRVQSLVQHLESVHDTTPYELRSAQIRRPPLQQEPLPKLPTHAPAYLVGRPPVMPSPSFNPSKALAAATLRADESEDDEWDDFASLDNPEASELGPFERLRWPEAGVERCKVRPIPRNFGEMVADEPQDVDQEEQDIDREEQDSNSSEDGPKVGYQYWKRRFEREARRQQRKNGGP